MYLHQYLYESFAIIYDVQTVVYNYVPGPIYRHTHTGPQETVRGHLLCDDASCVTTPAVPTPDRMRHQTSTAHTEFMYATRSGTAGVMSYWSQPGMSRQNIVAPST